MNHALRSFLAVTRNALRIEPEHLGLEVSHEAAVSLFSRFVEQLEIETVSFCNRTCSFCPNSFIDRRSERHPMPEDSWNAIVEGLREVRFAGTVVWSRYSEPFSELRLLDRVREVKAAAPGCRVAINTNGDYLDEGKLAEAAGAGIDRIMVDLYMPDDAPATLEYAHEWHRKFLRRIAREAAILEERPELVGELHVDGMQVITRLRNSATLQQIYASDRGGLLSIGRRTARTSPCYLPFKQLVVDWDGSVVPCCQIRSDAGAHARCVAGKLGKNVGLVDAYLLLAGWRSGLTGYGEKTGPCATCTYASYDSSAVTRLAARLASSPRLPARRVVQRVLEPLLGRRQTW